MSHTSLGRQTSDVAAAKMRDGGQGPGLGDLAEAVQHTQRPGKVGTVLIRPWVGAPALLLIVLFVEGLGAMARRRP
ncbi:hypothetical protein BX260_6359 [Streptomyces sp. 5112.2]|nr:hypothetical protein BX260_6359 [Streptomyces sp. 5112.2]